MSSKELPKVIDKSQADDELTKINKLLSLPYVQMRIVDWVPEVQAVARDRLKSTFLECPINKLMEYARLTGPLFFHYRPHSELIRKYFIKTYIPRQSIDDLYNCMSALNNRVNVCYLLKIISDRQLIDLYGLKHTASNQSYWKYANPGLIK